MSFRSTSGAGGSTVPSVSQSRWLFSKDEMERARSIQEGLTRQEELEYRQKATIFIQEMVDRLNESARDQRQKMSQLCMCSASIHMHRFFYYHSFKFFDYRDVAAACLFLAGKSEESPRKLEHIVKAWWVKKFPRYPSYLNASTNHYVEASQLIVQLENVVLQTIAFDLKVDLPHPSVLDMMPKVCVGGNPRGKMITEAAYFFATDILCVTDFAIRYPARWIAVLCVHIVCSWSTHKMPDSLPRPWFTEFSKDLTEDVLEDMVAEFLGIYKCLTERDRQRMSVTRFNERGILIVPAPSSPGVSKSSTGVGPLLPPPPPPPMLHQKKLDISDYKNRTPKDERSSGGGSANERTPQPRKSFMPDTNASSVVRDLPSLALPGITVESANTTPTMPSKEQKHHSVSNSSTDRHRKDKEERRKDREQRDKDRSERRRDETPEERHRRKEEERRKRHADHSSGHTKENAGGSHIPLKRPKPDVPTTQFVPSTAQSNGHTKPPSTVTQNATALKYDSKMLQVPPPISPPKPPTQRRYDPAPPMSAPLHPVDVSLPPPPLPPPVPVDLEEGEVE